MGEIDIWWAAKLLLDKHGVFAEDKAHERQLELLAEHDVEGFAVWSQILAAIGELQRTTKRQGERTQ